MNTPTPFHNTNSNNSVKSTAAAQYLAQEIEDELIKPARGTRHPIKLGHVHACRDDACMHATHQSPKKFLVTASPVSPTQSIIIIHLIYI